MRNHDSRSPSTATTKSDMPRPAAGACRDIPVLFHDRMTRLAQMIFIVFSIIAFAYLAQSVVLPVLLAWVICMTLKPTVRWLQRCRVPTTLAAALVVALAVAGVGTGMVYLGQPAIEWMQTAPEKVPRLKEKFQHILRPAIRFNEAASTVGSLDTAETVTHKPQPVEVKDNHVPASVFTWTGSLLAGIGETVALVFLLLVTGDVLVQKLVQTMPTLRDKRRAMDISHEIQQQISRYLFSVGLVNLGFGIAVGVALQLLGMPSALMWGGVAALLNFVPYFGPVVGMIVVALAGLFAFDTFGKALLPAGAYLILHLIEANAVTPFVLGRRFTINPVVIFVALIFCAWLWGVTGALLAVPLLVSLKVVCGRVTALAMLGEFLSSQEPVSKKSRSGD